MDIAIFVPTLYRAHNLPRLISSIEETSNCNIYFMCPEDDFDTIEIVKNYKYWTDLGDMRYVKRIQHMYENTDEDWFLLGSDDIVFHPMWLEMAHDLMDDYSVISFNDLCNPSLPGTNFLIRRKYIEEQSGVIDSPNTVLCQEYYHNFCDNELVGTANSRGQFFHCGGIIEHRHPMSGKDPYDEIYSMAQSNFHADAEIFHRRSRLWQ
jgi:hypothetical protein